MPPCRLEKFFRRGCRLDDNDNLDIFFCWEEFTLARARQGFYAGQVVRPGGSDAGQECDARKHKWHLCFPSASELETGTNHFLVAARVELTGNRHVPFFRSCPRGVPLNPGVTGLKEAILEFFPGNPLARAPMQGRRGGASMRGSWGLAGWAMPGRFAEIVGLDDRCKIFFLERIPTLARARQGSDAGQAWQGGQARQAPSRTLTVPRALAICAICAISHKASH